MHFINQVPPPLAFLNTQPQIAPWGSQTRCDALHILKQGFSGMAEGQAVSTAASALGAGAWGCSCHHTERGRGAVPTPCSCSASHWSYSTLDREGKGAEAGGHPALTCR